jgi:putative transposase
MAETLDNLRCRLCAAILPRWLEVPNVLHATLRHTALSVPAILAHHRRRVVHINVTEHPTAAWTAQQVVDAFPRDESPWYLLRDRDSVYGASFRQCVRNMGIEEVLIAPKSPCG